MRVFSLFLIASQAAGFTSFPTKDRLSSSLSMSAALIVQNKGGGHGELGFQLAKTLSSNSKISSITILQDDACKDTTEPFKSYQSDIPDVKIVKVSLGDEAMDADSIKTALGGQSFDYIWDNASKGAVGAGKAIVDCAKQWNCKLLTYVSSAGCYQPAADAVFPMSEATTPVKDSSGQVQYENYATEQGLPFVAFRPQYIYGPKSNKYDYIDWYFDRIMRELPLPIPGDGNQKVSLTNSEDVASLLASVLNDETAAAEQRIFNCGTDDLISYSEVAEMCAGVAGKKANIHLYDGESLGKGKFPFRLTDFYVAPNLAKEKLGWTGPKHSLKDDLPWYLENYQARGGDTKDLDLEKDQEILSS
mmetsp:Transcript_18553/g.28045  ORF Transcript_18553/g.28045 Transcript_18553/m.28045 type:complete len:361 (-) Transcript_18553:2383-3465(-)